MTLQKYTIIRHGFIFCKVAVFQRLKGTKFCAKTITLEQKKQKTGFGWPGTENFSVNLQVKRY